MSRDLAALRASVSALYDENNALMNESKSEADRARYNDRCIAYLQVETLIDALESVATTAAAKEDAALIQRLKSIREAIFVWDSHKEKWLEEMNGVIDALKTKQKENEPPKRKGGYGLEITLVRNQKKERDTTK